MTEIEKIMEITPENLAQKQLEALQNHALEIVKKLEDAIKNCDDSEVPTFFSPAGDGYGEDNTCINFGYMEKMEMDIEDFFWKLRDLKKIIEGGCQ